MRPVYSEINDIEDIKLKVNTNLSAYTTIKVQALGTIAIVSSIEALKKLIVVLKKHEQGYHLVGLGANQVLGTHDSKIYIKLKLKPIDELSEYKEQYHLDASIRLNQLSSHAMKFNLDGWQCLTGIPASLGGAICMNAGTRVGEIKDIVKEVTVLGKDLNIRTVIVNQSSFSYRHNHFLKDGDIIISAVLDHKGQRTGVKQEIKDYLDKRKVDQPWGTKNCGCVFKNNPKLSAGQAIDLLGLKGFSYKGLKISKIHANFIENTDGDYDSLKELISFIQYELQIFCGEKFELEVKID